MRGAAACRWHRPARCGPSPVAAPEGASDGRALGPMSPWAASAAGSARSWRRPGPAVAAPWRGLAPCAGSRPAARRLDAWSCCRSGGHGLTRRPAIAALPAATASARRSGARHSRGAGALRPGRGRPQAGARMAAVSARAVAAATASATTRRHRPGGPVDARSPEGSACRTPRRAAAAPPWDSAGSRRREHRTQPSGPDTPGVRRPVRDQRRARRAACAAASRAIGTR